jgi:hypothetical protein
MQVRGYGNTETSLRKYRDEATDIKDKATEIQGRSCGNTETSLRKYRDEAAEILRRSHGYTKTRLRKYRDDSTEIRRRCYTNTKARPLAEQRKNHCSNPGKGERFSSNLKKTDRLWIPHSQSH